MKLPDSVYEVMELVRSSPTGFLSRSEIPARLHNALDIAVAQGFLELDAMLYDTLYSLTDAGRGELAMRAETEGAPTDNKKRRKRKPSEVKALTEKQTEAVMVVGECNGDIAEAARRLSKDRKTVKQHYDAAMAKLGQGAGRKIKTEQERTGLRGQSEVADRDDSRARIKSADKRQR